MASASEKLQKETVFAADNSEERRSFFGSSRDAANGLCRVEKWLTAIVPARPKATILGAYVKHARAVWQLRAMGNQEPAMVTQPPAQGDYGGDLVPCRAPSRRLERI